MPVLTSYRIAAATVLALSVVTAPVRAAIIDVTPTSMGDWAFNNRDVNGTLGANTTGNGAMVNGPGTPPLGTGSANLATGNGTIGGDGTWELRNTGFAGVLLSNITTLTYVTYATQNNGQQFPYLGLHLSLDGGSDTDTILFFEPPYQNPTDGNAGLPDQGTTQLATWQTWDALAGGWWATVGSCSPGTGVESLATCLGAGFATATIVNAGTLGGVRFNVGFASPNDQFNGYIDALTIGIDNEETTFNFELESAAAVTAPGGLGLLGMGLIGLAALRRRSAPA